MKSVRSFLRLLVLAATIACSSHPPALAQARVSVSYEIFYDALAPYGQWIDDPHYGYVWVPDVPNDFRPYYTQGYWVMTSYGNTWYSDYPWGWAPFHYGRWTYDTYYGWVWIPGYEWGPAWVCWRKGYGYYGWAPLSPGFSIAISFGNYWCPADWWIFIPPAYIHHRHFHQYWHGPTRNNDIIRSTTIINNAHTDNRGGHFKYPTGPDRSDIQAETGNSVAIYRLNPLSQPAKATISENTLHIYRPDIDREQNAHLPQGIIKPQRPIEKPAEVGTNEKREPPFRSERPAGPVSPLAFPPAKNPIINRPAQPVESRPGRIERPAQSQDHNQPIRDYRNEQPIRRRTDEEIYRPRPQYTPGNPIERPNPQPARPVPARTPELRPIQPPIQRSEPRMDQPRQHMQVPQRDNIKPVRERPSRSSD